MIDLTNKNVDELINKHKNLLHDLHKIYQPQLAYILEIAIPYIQENHTPLNSEWKAWVVLTLKKLSDKDKLNSDPSEDYPRVIENSGELQDWPIYNISAPCGAGYMQLANVRTTRANTDGLYVSPDKNPDYAEQDKYHKTKSDRVFRRKINGVKRILTKPQYHINHERDNEEGCHITFQR